MPPNDTSHKPSYSIKFDDEDIDTATRIVYGEARNQPDTGKIAVAWVMRNRATWDETTLGPDHPEAEWWGTTIKSVCLHPYQFSCNNKNDPNYPKIWGLQKDDPAYINIRRLVVSVMNGEVADPTMGATMYKVRGTKASWDAEIEKLGKHPIEIGSHDFYKLGPHE